MGIHVADGDDRDCEELEVEEGSAMASLIKSWAMVSSGFLSAMALRTACTLRIPDILAKADSHHHHHQQLSLSQIASHLPSDSPNHDYLLRLMTLLSFHGIFSAQPPSAFSMDDDDMAGESEWKFGLTPTSACLPWDHKPFSVAPLLLMITQPVMQTPYHHLHECILDGGTAFDKAFGGDAYALTSQDPAFNDFFNNAMACASHTVLEAFLNNYHGLHGIQTLVDVGGGLGHAISKIVDKYPSIHGINFDLPHVIQTAPEHPGVVHVSGDMFQSIAKGDAIFMKWILHNWDNHKCVQILKNCKHALPRNGKVIIVDIVLGDMNKCPSNELALSLDLCMVAFGGKERTREQWTSLLIEAGFREINITKISSVWCTIEACL